MRVKGFDTVGDAGSLPSASAPRKNRRIGRDLRCVSLSGRCPKCKREFIFLAADYYYQNAREKWAAVCPPAVLETQKFRLSKLVLSAAKSLTHEVRIGVFLTGRRFSSLVRSKRSKDARLRRGFLFSQGVYKMNMIVLNDRKNCILMVALDRKNNKN